jgi:hypothetical protein
VRQHLTEVLGVEMRTAYMTISEMIGLGFGDTVKIEAAILFGVPSSIPRQLPTSGSAQFEFEFFGD